MTGAVQPRIADRVDPAEAPRTRLQSVADPRPATVDPRLASIDPAIGDLASLVVAHAGLLGRNLSRRDVIEALVVADAAPDSPADAVTPCYAICGLATQVRQVIAFTPDMWPALAQMRGGQWVLVLGQAGDAADGAVTIFEATSPDKRLKVPLSDFLPHFLGMIVQAEAPVAGLATAHVAPPAARPLVLGRVCRPAAPFRRCDAGVFRGEPAGGGGRAVFAAGL